MEKYDDYVDVPSTDGDTADVELNDDEDKIYSVSSGYQSSDDGDDVDKDDDGNDADKD
ncbi:hypothetical protein A2U01_0107873, partial [Trifolium medium]|nr:hypothetical protein [Trifolium medium]